MATKEVSIKLMIDPESNTLIFAEASKDFVDFLVYLLSLPIGIVTKLLSSESMVGSIGNVYTSVVNLDETFLRPNVNKSVILNPTVCPSPINTPLSAANKSYINYSRKFYTCWDIKCKRGITNVFYDIQCPGCNGDMSKEIKFIDKDSEGYVHNGASYMISDDLSITPISTMSIVSMLNKFNVTKPEERVVKIGAEEALELLNASLQSTTVLTDVFLRRKKRKQAGNEQRKISFCVRSPTGKTINCTALPSTTMYKLMAAIEDPSGLPPKNQVLFYDGRRLSGERTVADCNIVDGSVIDLLMGLKGC